MAGSATILRADARALPLADASVDAVVCDPPYGLEFMGKEWDSFKPSAARLRTRLDGRTNPTEGRSTTTTPEAYVAGAPFQRWCEQWATEAYRVLKPGGHMLAFGGSRTWHRLTCAIEDAGFEIRDSMAWMYGSGFPKSLDVSKAIDKRGGTDGAWFADWLAEKRAMAGLTRDEISRHFPSRTGGTTGKVWNWEHGHGIPTQAEFDTLCDLLGVGRMSVFDAEREVIAERSGYTSGYGPGDFRIPNLRPPVTAPATDAARRWQGWGTALKPGFEPIVVARKPLAGTVAANVLQFGTGAINIDACRIEGRERTEYGLTNATRSHGITFGNPSPSADFDSSKGRWPTNVVLSHSPLVDEHDEIVGDACSDGCVPGCPVAALDAQGGQRPSRAYARRGAASGDGWGMTATGAEYNDEGGASRFFPTFRYEAKAPDHERPRVDGVAHPTVKPLGFIRWGCRLVTPVGGRVLDMFSGSGTTLEAALLEGFDVIASENWEPYLPLIRYRLERAHRRKQPGITRLAAAKPPKRVTGQGDLFAEILEG